MRKQKVKKGRKIVLTIILYVLLLIFFGIIALYSWVSYFDQFEIAAIIDKNIAKVTITGEIVFQGEEFIIKAGEKMFFDLKPDFEKMQVEQGELLYFEFITNEKVLNRLFYSLLFLRAKNSPIK